jgi:3-dehydroquinate dehydratase
MKKITTFAAAVALAGIGLAGCDSPAEQNAEEAADAVEAKGEATADAMEERADELDPTTDGVDSPAEQNLENKAEAVREGADAKAEKIEDEAKTPPQ